MAGSLGGEARHSVVAFSAAETVHANQCSRLLENTFQCFAYLGLTVGWTELVLRHPQQTAPTESLRRRLVTMGRRSSSVRKAIACPPYPRSSPRPREGGRPRGHFMQSTFWRGGHRRGGREPDRDLPPADPSIARSRSPRSPPVATHCRRMGPRPTPHDVSIELRQARANANARCFNEF